MARSEPRVHVIQWTDASGTVCTALATATPAQTIAGALRAAGYTDVFTRPQVPDASTGKHVASEPPGDRVLYGGRESARVAEQLRRMDETIPALLVMNHEPGCEQDPHWGPCK